MKNALKYLLPFVLALPALAMADAPRKCRNEQLKGTYAFTATGFQRPLNSQPGTPWVPKAILEILQFNGDSTVSGPQVTVANPPGPTFDAGFIAPAPVVGGTGTYDVNDDCSGWVQFNDPPFVKFTIYVSGRGDTIRMIQVNPLNNVFQGEAKRVD